MNVTVESLAPCKKLMRVEIEAQKVDQAFESVMKDFRREASLPGFRPGKAPREMVLRKYEKEILLPAAVDPKERQRSYQNGYLELRFTKTQGGG